MERGKFQPLHRLRHMASLFQSCLHADMGALDGWNGVGEDDGPVHEQQILGERCDEVHPGWAPMRPGKPGGPAGDVGGGHDAWKRHGVS